MKTLIKSAAAFALGTTAVAAVPASAQQAPTVTVSFADLNLSSERGTEIFDRRIYNRCLSETAASVQPKRSLK